MNKFKILILMASYNGEAFIAQQIESIQNQNIREWNLLIRDDGSTDSTLNIISKYIHIDKRIVHLEDKKGNLGVINNFNELMRCALTGSADLIFFADQDDVWFPDKLEIFINKYHELADKNGSATPILVHSDMQVVDTNLNLIQASLMKRVGIKPVDKNPLNRLLIQNYVGGCAMACNRALLEICFPLPGNIIMHDWWFALCAAACGQIGSIESQTMQYRQHGDNQCGAKDVFSMCNPFSTFFREKIWQDGKKNLLATFDQALELNTRLSLLKNNCPKDVVKLAGKYSSCSQNGLFKRIKFILLNGIRPNHPFAILFFYFRLIIFDFNKKSEHTNKNYN